MSAPTLKRTNSTFQLEVNPLEVNPSKHEKLEKEDTFGMPTSILDTLIGNINKCIRAVEDDSWSNRTVDIHKKMDFFAEMNVSTGDMSFMPNATEKKVTGFVNLHFVFEGKNKVVFDREQIREALNEDKGLSITAAKILLITETFLSNCSLYSEAETDSQQTLYSGRFDKTKLESLVKDELHLSFFAAWEHIQRPWSVDANYDYDFLIGVKHLEEPRDEELKWHESKKLQIKELLVIKRADKKSCFSKVEAFDQINPITKVPEGKVPEKNSTKIAVDPKGLLVKFIKPSGYGKNISYTWS